MQKQDKILITGASGLIGSALVRLLKAEGYENLLTPTHEELNLLNHDNVFSYFAGKNIDYVFHLAAHVGGIYENSNCPAQFIYGNTLMQCHVFGACRSWEIKKLLFPGSACAYPKDAEQPIKESSFLQGMPEPTNLAYALAKQNGIVMAQSYAKQYGLNVVLPMVANTYGIGDRSSHVIPMLIEKIINGKNGIHLWGTGKPLREFIYADDVASAFLFLMQNYDSQEIINVGTMNEISITNLVHGLIGIMKWDGMIHWNGESEGVMQKCLDSSKLYAMGWEPKVSLEEGLRRVIDNL